MQHPDYSDIHQLLSASSARWPTPPKRTARSPAACAPGRLRLRGLAGARSCPRGAPIRPPPPPCEQLYAVTADSLGGIDMEFDLLMPGRCATDRRAHHGARRVVPGLSLRARRRLHADAGRLPGEVGEIVRDLTRDHPRRRRCGRQRGGQRVGAGGARRVRAGRGAAGVRGARAGCASAPPRRGRAAALERRLACKATARPA